MVRNRCWTRTLCLGAAGYLIAALVAWNAVLATPAGYVERTIPLNAPPVGLAFDASGVLYALEAADFGSNEATLRTILPNGDFGESFPVVGDDPENFFVGSMAYDPLADRLLISDNTGDGRLYAVTSTGDQQTIATGIAGISGITVRDSGEIFVTTSPFGSPGAVRQVSRESDASTVVMDDLGFGAGLAFDSLGLLVQDAGTSAPFRGRVRRVPNTPAGLDFGTPTPVVEDMQSAAGLMVDSEGDIFTTGGGGLYLLDGSPLAETPFSSNGNASQFATAIAFDPGNQPFEPFAGPDGSRLAYMADYGLGIEDLFITLLTPASSADTNSDGYVDSTDLATWEAHFGAAASPETGDADGDGVADGSDFLAWQRQINGGPPLLSGGWRSDYQIPEPHPRGLIGVAAIIFLGKSARRDTVKRRRMQSRNAAG